MQIKIEVTDLGFIELTGIDCSQLSVLNRVIGTISADYADDVAHRLGVAAECARLVCLEREEIELQRAKILLAEATNQHKDLTQAIGELRQQLSCPKPQEVY